MLSQWSTRHTCIPNGKNNLNLYSVFPQWSTLPARIPNGWWSLGLAVRRWWSSHVCRYSHRSSILRGQWTWSGQHETHIGNRTQIKPFLLSTKQSGLWRERKLQKMHCGADHSWNPRWSYWLPSKTHIVDLNCRKYWKHKRYWSLYKTHVDDRNCQIYQKISKRVMTTRNPHWESELSKRKKKLLQ